MYAQSLEGGEIINVRWATDDPNPASIEAVKRRSENEVINTIKAKLPKIGPKGTILDYENEYKQTRMQKDGGKVVHGNGYFYGNEDVKQAVYAPAAGAQISASSAYAVPVESKNNVNPIGRLAGYASSDDE